MLFLVVMARPMHLLLTALEGLVLAMDRSWLISLLMPCAGDSSEGRDDSEFLEHFAGGCFSNMLRSNHMQFINSHNRNCWRRLTDISAVNRLKI